MAIKIGTMLYHESRYWKTDNLTGDETPGWNARYLPYVVTNITAGRIYATGAGADFQTSHVQFPRSPKHRPSHVRPTTLEGDGKQYHSRFHEYFYTEIPKRKPRMSAQAVASGVVLACSLLGISPPYTNDDVNRAFKRKAREMHPDVAGGSHEGFIKLKEARNVALRGY